MGIGALETCVLRIADDKTELRRNSIHKLILRAFKEMIKSIYNIFLNRR